MSEVEYHVVVSVPGSPAQPFQLKGARAGLGRGADNQLAVDHESISGTQCEFRQVDGGYAVADVGSTNGTRVNGKKLESRQLVRLADGDRILLSEEVPVYFYHVQPGQAIPDTSAAAATDAASLETAAKLAAMGDKIESMKSQQAQLAAGIEQMKEELNLRRQDVAKVQREITEIETALLAKRKQLSPDGASATDLDEISQMEDELMSATRRWKVMASDLEGQEEQLQRLGSEIEVTSSLDPMPLQNPPLSTPATVPLQTTPLVSAPAAPLKAGKPAASSSPDDPAKPAGNPPTVSVGRPADAPSVPQPAKKASASKNVALKKANPEGPPALKKKTGGGE